VLSIDRYAFWLSIFVGIGSWMYIESRRIPAALTPNIGHSFVDSVSCAGWRRVRWAHRSSATAF
jgi:hypothetical protein